MKGICKTITHIFIFPLYFLIVFPVEYGVWKEYRKQNKTTHNLIKWTWNRM